jgi:hypothetical protein
MQEDVSSKQSEIASETFSSTLKMEAVGSLEI